MNNKEFDDLCEDITSLSNDYVYLNHIFTKEQKEYLIQLYFSDEFLISNQRKQDFIYYISYYEWHKSISNADLLVRYIFQEDLTFAPFNIKFIEKHKILSNIDFNNDVFFSELCEYFLDKNYNFIAQDKYGNKLLINAKNDFLKIINTISKEIKETFIINHIESFTKICLIFNKDDKDKKTITKLLNEFNQLHNTNLLLNIIDGTINFETRCNTVKIICSSKGSDIKDKTNKI